ncbi:hypothetical protein BD626DRAFT_491597 [Schizophyllum amplum]|uniref:Uncharacterized protein n=1 Tax=Schizophyllum amplum TaxID=97359 RepID=A0A550CI27_9AGAR|nr:hypothetical protein BD626DRAFT_491597 [Auriculariopsis ampla]
MCISRVTRVAQVQHPRINGHLRMTFLRIVSVRCSCCGSCSCSCCALILTRGPGSCPCPSLRWALSVVAASLADGAGSLDSAPPPYAESCSRRGGGIVLRKIGIVRRACARVAQETPLLSWHGIKTVCHPEKAGSTSLGTLHIPRSQTHCIGGSTIV